MEHPGTNYIVALALLAAAVVAYPIASVFKSGSERYAATPEDVAEDISLCESVGGRYDGGCEVY